MKSRNHYLLSLLFAVCFLFVFSAFASADQTLTFEGFADGTVLTTQYPGINFQGATILQENGSVTFYNYQQFPPHSGIDVVYNPSGPMQLVFSTPISYFEGYVTYNAGMTIQGFNASNVLVDTATGAWSANYIGSGQNPNELLEIQGANITTVVLTGGGGNNFTLDDVTFSGSIDVNAVPEPATMLLLGSGLIGLAGYGRRKFFTK